MSDRHRQTTAGLVVTVLLVALLVAMSIGAVVLVGTAPVAAQSNETGDAGNGATTGAPPGGGPSGNATAGGENDSSGDDTDGDSSDRVESALPDTSSGSGAGTNKSSNETGSENGLVDVDLNMRTSVENAFAVGSMIRNQKWEAVISAGDGGAAALQILSTEAGEPVHDFDTPNEE